MTAPSGREPAQPASGADAARSNTAQPRLSREAVVAFVLLPVLLAAGFFLGSRLLGDAGEPTQIDAAASQTSEPDGGDSVAGPPAESPPVQGPAEPSQAPSPEPTQAAPSPEPTQAAPSPEPPPAPPADPPATSSAAAPNPQAGDSVLLFPGFAGDDVRTWQARMAERGWVLTVDGIYGAESESVARRFQAEKGLSVDGLVGIHTWNATWDAPVTPA